MLGQNHNLEERQKSVTDSETENFHLRISNLDSKTKFANWFERAAVLVAEEGWSAKHENWIRLFRSLIESPAIWRGDALFWRSLRAFRRLFESPSLAESRRGCRTSQAVGTFSRRAKLRLRD